MATKPAELTRSEAETKKVSRRTFVKGAATIATVAAVVPLEPLLGGKESIAEASVIDYHSAHRANDSFNYRKSMAQAQKIDVGVQPDNGDTARFSDFSCSYSKALLHDGLGVPNAAAWLSLKHSTCKASTHMPPLSHRRRGSAARRRPPNRSNTTGVLCWATCRSPNTRQIRWLVRLWPT